MWYTVKEASDITGLTTNQIYYRMYPDEVKRKEGCWKVSDRFTLQPDLHFPVKKELKALFFLYFFPLIYTYTTFRANLLIL